MKIRSIVKTVLLASSFNMYVFIHTVQPNSNEQAILEETVRTFRQPVKTSSSGVATFLEQEFNHHLYSDFLSNDFSHVIQFLDHGKKTKQPKAYIQSVIRLFTNKMKEGMWVNAYSFDALLQQVPSLIDCYFLGQRATNLHTLQEKINTLLYEQFKNNFSAFQTNPSTFLHELTQEILDALRVENQDLGEISAEELRKSILIFLEIGISKLVWSPEDQLDTWHNVKSISEHLTTLMDCNILADPDDLNGLFISLIERYCFFLDLAGDALSPAFYETVQHEIETISLPLLDAEEQEPLIKTKKERLTAALAKARG